MIQFLYTSDYDEATPTAIVEENGDGQSNDVQSWADDYECLVCHVRLYAIADKYDIEDLKSLAKSKFQSSISGRWPIRYFPALIQGILKSTPPRDWGLREIITPICVEHITELWSERTIISHPPDSDSNSTGDAPNGITLEQALNEDGAFAIALFAEVVHSSSARLMDSENAYSGLSQESITYRETSDKEITGLSERLRHTKDELDHYKYMMRTAARQPFCCPRAGFNPIYFPGNHRSSARFRLRCAGCGKICN